MATQLNTTAALPDQTVPAKVTPAATESHISKWAAIAPVDVTAILALIPAPSGLPHFAWLYFSIFAGVIVGLVLEPLPGDRLPLCRSAVGIPALGKQIKLARNGNYE